jgi:hypothetical protein
VGNAGPHSNRWKHRFAGWPVNRLPEGARIESDPIRSSSLGRVDRRPSPLWMLAPSPAADCAFRSIPGRANGWDRSSAPRQECTQSRQSAMGRATPAKSWRPTPLLYVLNDQSDVTDSLGSVTYEPGSFKSWALSRVLVGSLADSLLAVRLSDATMLVYGPVRAGAAPSLIRTTRLPQYFRSPTLQEEVWSPSWIQMGGDLHNLLHVAHIATGAFDSRGRVYAVRNYMAEWRRIANRYLLRRARGKLRSRGLRSTITRAGGWALSDCRCHRYHGSHR